MFKFPSGLFFKIYTLVRAYAEGIILTILFAIILRVFVVTPYRIPNNLMAPNLIIGDFILAYRLPYGIRVPFTHIKLGEKLPHRGDLVVFPCPKTKSITCLRRVVGLPGDRLEIRGERLFINGQQADYELIEKNELGVHFKETIEDHQYEIFIRGNEGHVQFGPVIVGPQSVFLLSDHRDLGEDSRSWGGVHVQEIEARVAFIWLSLDWLTESRLQSSGPALRWERLFQSPH
ncbi:MAG: signal peptidase I [Bdellovibrionales bacterium]|nr:signal peptidase I [Bdellovibrionales bacterium]